MQLRRYIVSMRVFAIDCLLSVFCSVSYMFCRGCLFVGVGVTLLSCWGVEAMSGSINESTGFLCHDDLKLLYLEVSYDAFKFAAIIPESTTLTLLYSSARPEAS